MFTKLRTRVLGDARRAAVRVDRRSPCRTLERRAGGGDSLGRAGPPVDFERGGRGTDGGTR